MFRVVRKSLKNLGIFPLERNILSTGAATAHIEDKVTRRIVYSFQGVKAASQTFDLSARALANVNVSFVAIRSKDESEV